MTTKQCIVACCKNTSENAAEKIFLTVPADHGRRKKWFQAIRATPNFSHTLYCCEDHFDLEADANNWMYYKTMGRRIILKNDVVPHKNLLAHEQEVRSPQLTSSNKKRKLEMLQHAKEPAAESARKELFCPETPPTSGVLYVADIATIGYLTPIKLQSKPRLILPAGTGSPRDVSDIIYLDRPAAKATSKSPPTKSLSSSSSGASTSSRSVFPQLEHTIRLHANAASVETKSGFYLGIPEEVYEVVRSLATTAQVSYRDVLITIKKIRRDDAYSTLAANFNTSTADVERIFASCVPKLANVMRELIYWPDSGDIRKCLPRPFVAGYEAVESIIDCLEIRIETPGHVLMTTSPYESCHTLKYLVSATPNGFVNFVSGGCEGGNSDELMVEESGYVDVLPFGSCVIADRGFEHVAAVLAAKSCTLIRPPSVAGGPKSPRSEESDGKIASLRIHVERVIARLREFEMLGPQVCIDTGLLYLMNHIAIIACGIINIQRPLIT